MDGNNVIRAKVFFPLTQGQVGVCDFEDWWEFVRGRRWFAHKKKSQNGSTFYIRRSHNHRKPCGKHTCSTIHLHREIMKPAKEMDIDHIDTNGLNDCRSNLRICTRMENANNVLSIEKLRNSIRKKSRKTKNSGFLGITLTKKKYWQSRILGKYIGLSKTKIEAAIKVDKYLISIGEEPVNFPRENYEKN